MAYKLKGSSLEACTCEANCPCWAGSEASDACDTVLSWRIDSGTIEGVDVSGRAVAVVADVPCSALPDGAAGATLYVDDEATSRQEKALLDAWTGRLGGLVADLARLFGEVTGTEPLRKAEGRHTTIHEGVLDAAPGSAAEWTEDPPSQEYSAVRARFRFEA